jgi:hypothetical protein
MGSILPEIAVLMTKSVGLQKIIKSLLCRNWPFFACVIQFSLFAAAALGLLAVWRKPC